MAALKLVSPTQTAEERLAWLRMEETRVLATACARCSHPLAAHSRISTPACKQFSHRRACKCRGFQDPSERLLSQP